MDQAISEYEDIVKKVASFLSISNQLSNEVAQQGKLVCELFKVQLDYIVMAKRSPQPNSSEQSAELLNPTSSLIQQIQNIREKNRASPFFNHLSTISESIPALGWVAVSPAPAPYIKEMIDAGQFYANRVLKEFKEKEKLHSEFVKCWIEILSELQRFVKQYYTTGLTWLSSAAVCNLPPPPPPPVFDFAAMSVNGGEADTSNDRSALFAEINKGEGITKSLKKVSSDMQTHKNSNLRCGAAPFKKTTPSPSVAGTNEKAGSFLVVKPPVFKRDGKKWIIENYKDNHGILVDGTEMNNVVYIYGCVNCTVTVKGKINSIFVDSCHKTSVLFDTVVSSVEFVNCRSTQMQVLGKVPTITIDKTDGCQMYLNSESLDVEIVSCKSSEMNVLVPSGAGDYKEYAVPEQYKTNVTSTGLRTVVIENKG